MSHKRKVNKHNSKRLPQQVPYIIGNILFKLTLGKLLTSQKYMYCRRSNSPKLLATIYIIPSPSWRWWGLHHVFSEEISCYTCSKTTKDNCNNSSVCQAEDTCFLKKCFGSGNIDSGCDTHCIGRRWIREIVLLWTTLLRFHFYQNVTTSKGGFYNIFTK